MPVKTFSFLLSNLHLNDQTEEPKKGDANFDKLYNIRPFIEKISETYLHYYDPTREKFIIKNSKDSKTIESPKHNQIWTTVTTPQHNHQKTNKIHR